MSAWGPDVRPILVLTSAALSEQGYDTAELDANTSAPIYVSRGTHIDSQVDTTEWDNSEAAEQACQDDSDASSFCAEQLYAMAAIGSLTESLELGDYGCERLYANPKSVECLTRYWRVTLSYRLTPFRGGKGKLAAEVWVHETGHGCWWVNNTPPC